MHGASKLFVEHRCKTNTGMKFQEGWRGKTRLIRYNMIHRKFDISWRYPTPSRSVNKRCEDFAGLDLTQTKAKNPTTQTSIWNIGRFEFCMWKMWYLSKTATWGKRLQNCKPRQLRRSFGRPTANVEIVSFFFRFGISVIGIESNSLFVRYMPTRLLLWTLAASGTKIRLSKTKQARSQSASNISVSGGSKKTQLFLRRASRTRREKSGDFHRASKRVVKPIEPLE